MKYRKFEQKVNDGRQSNLEAARLNRNFLAYKMHDNAVDLSVPSVGRKHSGFQLVVGAAIIAISSYVSGVLPISEAYAREIGSETRTSQQLQLNGAWKTVADALEGAQKKLTLTNKNDVQGDLGDALMLIWADKRIMKNAGKNSGAEWESLVAAAKLLEKIADAFTASNDKDAAGVLAAGLVSANSQTADFNYVPKETQPNLTENKETKEKSDKEANEKKAKEEKEKSDREAKEKSDKELEGQKKLQEQKDIEAQKQKELDAQNEQNRLAKEKELQMQKDIEAQKQIDEQKKIDDQKKTLSPQQKVEQSLAGLDKEYKEKNGTFATLDELKDFASRLKKAVDDADKLGVDIEVRVSDNKVVSFEEWVEKLVDKLDKEEKRLKATKTEKTGEIKKDESKVDENKKQEETDAQKKTEEDAKKLEESEKLKNEEKLKEDKKLEEQKKLQEQKDLEAQKQKELDDQKQKDIEAQKQIEAQKKIDEQKDLELQKQKEVDKQNEINKQKELDEQKKIDAEKKKTDEGEKYFKDY